MLTNYRLKTIPQMKYLSPETKPKITYPEIKYVKKTDKEILEDILQVFPEKQCLKLFPTIYQYPILIRFENPKKLHEKILNEMKNFLSVPDLSVKQLRYFLDLLVIKKINTVFLKRNCVLLLNTIVEKLNSEKDRNEIFNINRVEIFWSLQKLNFKRDIFQKIKLDIIDCFMQIIQENPPLAFLYLATELDMRGYYLKIASINPLPDILKEITDSKDYIKSRKLLDSVALLRCYKDTITAEQNNQLLDSIPPLLASVRLHDQRKSSKFLKIVFESLTKLNFNMHDLERKFEGKSIVQHILDHFEFCKNQINDDLQLATILWSMAVMDIPTSHDLYKTFVEKCLPKLEKKIQMKIMSDKTIPFSSKILFSHLVYSLNLSQASIQKLHDNLIQEPQKEPSRLHQTLEGIILKLLEQARLIDPTIPSPPKKPREFIMPWSYGAISVDTMLSPDFDFAIEYDGVEHIDALVADNFKNRILAAKGVTLVRIKYNDELNKMTPSELQSYLTEIVIKPYIKHHKNKTQLFAHKDTLITEIPIEHLENIEKKSVTEDKEPATVTINEAPQIELMNEKTSESTVKSTPQINYSDVIKKYNDAAEHKLKSEKPKSENKPHKKSKQASIPKVSSTPPSITPTEEKKSSPKKITTSSDQHATLKHVNGLIILPSASAITKTPSHPNKRPKTPATKKATKQEKPLSATQKKELIYEYIDDTLNATNAENADTAKADLLSMTKGFTSVTASTLEKVLKNNLSINKQVRGCCFFKKTVLTIDYCKNSIENALRGKKLKVLSF